jgi:glycerol uptake facilitator-like aquaporin
MTSASRWVTESLGTLFLVLAVVGSGIMAQLLTADVGLQLLINAAATVAMLYILINLIAPLSGAHFNPVVSLVAFLRRERELPEMLGYMAAQVVGAISGSLLAHVLFDREVIALSTFDRQGFNLLLAEVIATFGLIIIVFADWKKFRVRHRATLISLWIGAAYFFTSSTSFANPAVTIGRIFTDSFAGISPESAPLFIVVQIAGGLLAFGLLISISKSLKTKKESQRSAA